jgi:uncharacterized protein YjbI with pentapeptide repeats
MEAPSLELHDEHSSASLRNSCLDAWDDGALRYRFDAVDFRGAVFHGLMSFENAEFGSATFSGATFAGPVSFSGAVFHGDARFDSVTFEGSVSFRKAVFEGEATFEHPPEEEEVQEWPEEVSFKRWADFRQARFEKNARFGGALFERRARFRSAVFEGDAAFTGATFTRARTIGPMEVAKELELDRVVFGAPVRIRAAAGLVSCKGTQFQSLTTIDLFRGDIRFDEAAFAEPSTVTGRGSDPKPRVLSLHQTNVAHLTLADLDLRECSFLGVHNLDGLRFEGAIDFCARGTPRTIKRQAILDELELHERTSAWAGGAADKRAAEERATAERIARAYRALRKGREDSKDAPGAADFYYGEMEMRRRAARGGERAILTLYWLVSGYGLRASRALIALAATVLVFAVAFDSWGFDPDGAFGKSLLFSTESTSSLFRAPEPPGGAELTDAGHVLQMCLRLLGPLFFGLALLALRGRVKR